MDANFLRNICSYIIIAVISILLYFIFKSIAKFLKLNNLSENKIINDDTDGAHTRTCPVPGNIRISRCKVNYDTGKKHGLPKATFFIIIFPVFKVLKGYQTYIFVSLTLGIGQFRTKIGWKL
jgi:hypothetical protein